MTFLHAPRREKKTRKIKFCTNELHTTFTLGDKIPINNPWLHSTEKLEKE